MNNTKEIDVNRAPTIAAVSLLAAITPAPAVLSPLLVGIYVTDLGISPQQGGYLIASELIGAALSTFSTLFLIGRVSWHRILYCSLAIIIFCYLLSVVITSIDVLMTVRFISGLALGTVMTLTIVVSGMMKNQERAFGFWSLGQIIFAVISFAIFPLIFPVIGLQGFFVIMAVMMSALLFPVRFMPRAGRAEHNKGFGGIPVKTKKLAPFGLLALFLFYAAIGGVWAYVERIADQAGFKADLIGYILSISSLAGVVGAAAATWVSKRYGRFLPSLCGYLLIAAGMLLLFGLESVLFYTLASLIFKFSWWFTAPYLLANMTNLDPSGRIAIIVNFVVACGMGLGPALAALVLDYTMSANGVYDYNAVIIFGVLCLFISFPLLCMVIRVNSQAEKQLSAAE
ncbi:hypothetical protein MNBD_ALPHA01-1829 [hydrothermal vent metagenome]|uniref:Major facilitator superfamily (MFS) profile domain-containing protein n=1 Tax=hydrothermal vent metagenome TaxID=652676 RepID=A0A3B0T523_9ZZZZ